MILTSNQRIALLVALGQKLSTKDASYQEAKEKAYLENRWFIPENIDKAVDSLCEKFLKKDLLRNWLLAYPEVKESKKIGLIMAGNIPLVGFHDFISIFVSGHFAQLKLSSKDEVLMNYVLDSMLEIEPAFAEHFEKVERLTAFDAVIATGSNNTSRYFEYYFGKYPHIIRKNRNGTAVLKGNESEEDLLNLSKDVFDFFGLGCRNITKIYVPESYDFTYLLGVLERNEEIGLHYKYKNNYDYNYAIYLLNKDNILVSNNLILKEDPSYLSRIACLHYESYNELQILKEKLELDEELIQCIATSKGDLLDMENEVPFGKTQQPALFDYADGVDTMAFLTELA